MVEDELGDLVAQLLGVRGLQRGAERAVGDLAPGGVVVGIGLPWTGGGELVEDVFLGRKPTCPLGPVAPVGTVLEMDERGAGQLGEVLEDVPEQAVAWFSMDHRMPRRKRSRVASRTTS